MTTSRSQKLYRVIFTDTRWIRIELEASSAKRAVTKAERLYLQGDPGDPRFEDFGGDAFSDPSVEEVVS